MVDYAYARVAFQEIMSSLAETHGDLCVLLVGCDASGNLDRIQDELASIEACAKAWGAKHRLKASVERLEKQDASLDKIEELLVQTPRCHILHFACHGYHNKMNPDESGIFLMRDGRAEPVSCAALERVLGPHVDFLFFNACYSGAVSGSAGTGGVDYLGTIHAGLAAGIHRVLGYRWQVSDCAASEFAKQFYSSLLGETAACLGQAVVRARWRAYASDVAFDSWASPLLVANE